MFSHLSLECWSQFPHVLSHLSWQVRGMPESLGDWSFLPESKSALMLLQPQGKNKDGLIARKNDAQLKLLADWSPQKSIYWNFNHTCSSEQNQTVNVIARAHDKIIHRWYGGQPYIRVQKTPRGAYSVRLLHVIPFYKYKRADVSKAINRNNG